MSIEIPSDVLPFVQSMIACGQFASAAEVVGAALRSYQQDVQRLRGEILPALEECRQGGGIAVDEQGLMALKDDIRTRVRAKVAAERDDA